MSNDKKAGPGPAPERVKLTGDWKKAVKKALDKPRPTEGWPKPEKK
jgi:hypothetical protein